MLTSSFLDFLTELKANNNREWFHANKKRFEQEVKQPFEAFVAQVIELMQIHNTNLNITPKEAIFRIYRDTRFSKDKTPYKTNVSAIIGEGGRKNMHSSGIYIEISDDRSAVYSGVYQPNSKQVQAIREHIVSNLEEFEDLIAAPAFVDAFGTIRGEKYKRIPKEFRTLAEQQPLLLNKAFYFFREFEPKVALQDDFVEVLVDHYLIARPLADFLKEPLLELEQQQS